MNTFHYIAATALAIASVTQAASVENSADRIASAPLVSHHTSAEGQVTASYARPASVVTDVKLSKRWLKDERMRNQPSIVIGRDDASALLVGYQDRSGKRVLFRSAYLFNDEVVSEVLHWNATTGRIERLIAPSDDIDASTGQRLRDFKVNGINLLGHLKAKRNKQPGHEISRDKVAAFLDSEDGAAFLSAVPAMYAALEDDEISDRQPKLKKPFGMMAMMLQMSGERYKGLPDAEHFASSDKRKKLSDSCAGSGCQMRGKGFVIHQSGLFDVISKPKAVRTPPKAAATLNFLTRQSSAPSLGKALGITGNPPLPSMNMESREFCSNDKANDPCFGKCGTGCGIIDPMLPECQAHDWCVCRFGGSECMYTIPEGCATEPEGCASLVDAVIAVSAYVFDSLFNMFANSTYNVTAWVAEFVFGALQVMALLVNDVINGIIDMVGVFLDSLFGEDCGYDEESPESC